MKLSRIIELAFIRFYGPEQGQDQFMCNAVDTLYRQGMITKAQEKAATKLIEEMLLSLYPDFQCYTLLDALYRANKLPDKEIFRNMQYTTQLYVWWVFDLKNRGL